MVKFFVIFEFLSSYNKYSSSIHTYMPVPKLNIKAIRKMTDMIFICKHLIIQEERSKQNLFTNSMGVWGKHERTQLSSEAGTALPQEVVFRSRSRKGRAGGATEGFPTGDVLSGTRSAFNTSLLFNNAAATKVIYSPSSQTSFYRVAFLFYSRSVELPFALGDFNKMKAVTVLYVYGCV